MICKMQIEQRGTSGKDARGLRERKNLSSTSLELAVVKETDAKYTMKRV